MEIHFLDMGTEKYGDCIIIEHNNRKILIDGAHPGDDNFLLRQFKKIFGTESPYKFDLLIMTHCHSDHIGALPSLIQSGEISAKKSLLANPVYRWGEDNGDSAEHFSDAAILHEALLEEDRADMSEEELEKFLFDAPRLLPGYKKMIEALENQGKVILYDGNDENDYSALEQEFKDFGLKILGPSAKHLRMTQDSLGVGVDDAIDSLRDSIDSAIPLTEAYRRLASKLISDDPEGLADKTNKGAINNQSTVIKVKASGWSALLAGDMQFAKAEVTGMEDTMRKLLDDVNDAGPYDVIKLTHHTSYNGTDEEMLDKWLEHTKIFVHTGGKRDKSHPEESVLDMLKERKSKLKFIRNDRHGIMTIGKDSDNKLSFWLSKGQPNNFTPNEVQDTTVAGENVPGAGIASTTEPLTIIPPEEQSVSSGAKDTVEVIARIPNHSTRVTITIDIDDKKKTLIQQTDTPAPTISNQNRFRDLIFVTCTAKLKENIGKVETDQVTELIGKLPGARLIDVPASVTEINQIRALIKTNLTPNTRGIVIVGGYDIIPATQLDTIDDKLRQQLVAEGDDDNDDDDFIVWSDDTYGDTDGDWFPELPVSRIPDGKSSTLVINALTAPSYDPHSKFGIRNLARPFAAPIYDIIPSKKISNPLEISEKCTPAGIPVDRALGSVYYMLHGVDHDATRFWGERAGGSMYEAIDINNIPASASGSVVFSGCCWGALIVLPPASRKTSGVALRSRTAEQSIALAYLKGGALAFVGCTGTHYSPSKEPYDYFGKPMHDAFWSGMKEGKPPAQALFDAKVIFARKMPHGLKRSLSQAIEMKILRQFTCLGLGW
jgi:beta-lactamase superfamily II metal-dependent hydrolase